MSAVEIPTERHKPHRTKSSYLWMIYGPPKIGKTTWANGWPMALFLATEPGTAAMEAADMQIANWTDFRNVVMELKKSKEKHRWETLVIDTVDNLYEFLVDDVCRANGWDDLGDAGYGKGYKLARRKLTNAIAAVRGLGMSVIFISHERREIEVDEQGKRSGEVLVTSALPGSARKVLHGVVDFIFRAEMDEEGNRTLRTAPHRDGKVQIECGSRGELGRPLPQLLELNYEALEVAFEKAFEAKTKETEE